MSNSPHMAFTSIMGKSTNTLSQSPFPSFFGCEKWLQDFYPESLSGFRPPIGEMDRNGPESFLQGSGHSQLPGGKLRSFHFQPPTSTCSASHQRALLQRFKITASKIFRNQGSASPNLIIEAASLCPTLNWSLASAHAMEGEFDKFFWPSGLKAWFSLASRTRLCCYAWKWQC